MHAASRVVPLLLVPAIATADSARPAHDSTPPPPATTVAPVVGGENAPSGRWPDAAAVLFGGQQACSGTLIAPTVAITAGHCDDASLDKILVGTTSLARPSDGETLSVTKRVELTQNDITVLVLGQASRFEPRAIASGWASFDIANGAPVEIVGYGAIDNNANQYIDDLQEAQASITDFDCTIESGCDQFELGAGGNGIDSCNGDSGGPLYLLTDYGDFLVGVTSRAYNDATAPCGGGGIYGRPDQVLTQIETAAGVPVTHGPEPTAEPVIAVRGDAGETTIDTNDPKSDQHTFEIVTPPAMGTAAVRDDGRVRVCANLDATPGNDSLTVEVTDANDTSRHLQVVVPISLAVNQSDGSDCDVNAFEDGGAGGGCCETSSGGHPAGLLPLVLGVVFGLRRRRHPVVR